MEDPAEYKTARVNAHDVVPGKVFADNGRGIEICARFDLRGVTWVCFASLTMAVPVAVPLYELLPRLNQGAPPTTLAEPLVNRPDYAETTR